MERERGDWKTMKVTYPTCSLQRSSDALSFLLSFFFLSLLNHTLISHLVLQCCFDTRSKSSRDDALFLYSFHSLHSVISSYDFLDRSIELRGWYKRIRMRSSFDGHGWIESRQGGLSLDLLCPFTSCSFYLLVSDSCSMQIAFVL